MATPSERKVELAREAINRLDLHHKCILMDAVLASPMVSERCGTGDWRGFLRAVRGLAVRSSDDRRVRYCSLLQALQDVTPMAIFILR